MQVIQDSAEHHFLTLLEKIRTAPAGWVGIHCAFARKIEHDSLMDDFETISKTLENVRAESTAALESLSKKAAGFEGAVLYQFHDSDLLIIAHPAGEKAHDEFYGLFKDVSESLKSGLVDFVHFGRDIQGAQKLADRKLLAEKRMTAYKAMMDANKIASIPLRRQRRDNAIVMIVEDDRFTAAYTTGVLAKDYELVHSKTGEEAIIDYIDHAPDIVFLDIHLPGINGLETLYAIRRADPAAYVVIVSVDTVKSNITTATERGAAGFLRKPFSRDRIVGMVEACPFIRGGKALINRP